MTQQELMNEVVSRKDTLTTQFNLKASELNELNNKIEKVKADMNAIDGALQDCDYWLEKLQPKENAVKQKEEQ